MSVNSVGTVFQPSKKKKWKTNSTINRLDTFYASILLEDQEFKEIMEVVKTSLIFYHDNASVQGGFSINKSILVEIQHEENLIAQRKGYDLIIHYNSIVHTKCYCTLNLSEGTSRLP